MKKIISILLLAFSCCKVQDRDEMFSDLTTMVNQKKQFIEKPISNLIDEINYDIKGYSLQVKGAATIQEAKISYINFFFLDKENEIQAALRGRVTDGTENECLILNIKIKNYTDFSLIESKSVFPNSTDENNWNSSTESAILNSGIIVEDLNIITE